MRNLKKILALVLALVMSFSLMATANAFTDSDKINGTYEEAVEVLSALKVFQGYENGSFVPQGSITRAEVAAIIYRIVTGDVTNKQVGIYADYNKFDDVKSTSWYAGYVNFCANAEYIKGYDAKTFGPNDPVTGYQALAMILRAVGYDKNGEFTGAGWQTQTAAVGKKLGITDNVSEGTLGVAATREVVAEILFRSILVPQVEYTVAFGYQSIGQVSIGYETFKLVGAVSGSDVWGRPAKVWKLDADNDKVAEASDTTLIALAYEPVATYTTAVDECDIAKDLGITSSATIEAAYIDGESYRVTDSAVTTNRYGTINAKATTSYVGAQGRLTEIYDMGVSGYRIVEINTYLANVTGVTAEKVDKNGHITPAYITMNVYADNYSAGAIVANTRMTYETTGYNVGDYVLVTVYGTAKGDVVASVEAAPVHASGALKGFTNATTVVGETTYNDADKFVLNNTKNINDVSKNYDVYVDAYGNIIGMVESAKNYLVIEAIRWIHDGTLYGGQAIANVVLADGSRVENVTIASVGGKMVRNVDNVAGDASAATVSDYYTNNTEYYNHLTSYAVNADGTYSIGIGTPDTTVCNAANLSGVAITTGLTTISNSTNRIVANDNTVFLVKDYANGQPNYTYTTYVGKNNVPSMTNANICYLTNGGYATVVVVTSYELASNTFVAYVPAEASASYVNGYWNLPVYKLGETTPTIVYFTNQALIPQGQDGFYTITVNAGQLVTNCVWFMGTYDTDAVGTGVGPHANYMWDRAFVRTALVGNSLQTSDKTGTSAVADYYVDNAKYFTVEKYTYPTGAVATTLTEVDASAIAAGQKVVVGYTTVNGVKQAAYVYIILDDQGDVNVPPVSFQIAGNITITGTQAGITLTGLTFTYQDANAVVAPGKGGTINVSIYKFADNGYTWLKNVSDTMPGTQISNGTWTLNKTITTTLAAGEYYATVTVTMADGTTATYNQCQFTVA